MQMEVSELRKGSKLVLDGDPWVVVDYQFVKPGKGQALYKCKMRNMISGSLVDRTYRSGEKLRRRIWKKIKSNSSTGTGKNFTS